jgi:hypothetical protein
MLPTIRWRTVFRAATLTMSLVVAAACGKKSETRTDTASGAIAPSTGTVQVTEVTVGRGITPDKHVANATSNFTPSDTIVASVHTTGAASNTKMSARWTFQDGQVVNESTETISPSGDAWTEFHISKPSGWPAGKYTVHILLNGQEVQTKDFTVAR